MHINELLSETQVDEITLGGVGRGIEKTIGGLAKGVGYVAGIPGGIAQKYQQGKARATAGIGGTMAQQPVQAKQPNPTFTQSLKNYQQYGSATAPAGAQTNAGQDPAAIRQQANQLRKQADDLEKQAQQAQQKAQQDQQAQQKAQQDQSAPATSFAQGGGKGTAVPTNPFQVPGAVTPKLNVQSGGKTTATGTNESTEFYSNFLGKAI
jgi:hypothetical protein